jgi:hypothetical protein
MKKTNPFNQFLFSIPGKKGKYTFKEVQEFKGMKNKSLEVVDTSTNQRLGKMKFIDVILKFQ